MTEQEKVNYGRLANKVLIERIKASESLEQMKITYKELAEQIGIPPENIRSAGFSKLIGSILGVTGKLLFQVSKTFNMHIPVLNTLVCRADTEMPSSGLKYFVEGYDSMTEDEQDYLIKGEYIKIQYFPKERWDEVLVYLWF